MGKTPFGRRKDGRAYPKRGGKAATESDLFAGKPYMTYETYKKIEKKNARRSKIARLTDNAKKANIDRTGKRWLHNPSRYDVVGIDAKNKHKK